MLTPLKRKELLSIWSDEDIMPGAQWAQEISTALNRAKLAVLLVSDNFLSSKFIAEQELPPLLAAARSEGLTIMWVLLSSCLYESTDIAQYQAAHDVTRPLDSVRTPQRKNLLAAISRKILKAAQ